MTTLVMVESSQPSAPKPWIADATDGPRVVLAEREATHPDHSIIPISNPLGLLYIVTGLVASAGRLKIKNHLLTNVS